jgi:hypothetical protein
MTLFEVIKRLETFCNSHLQVQKFGADFLEQLPNFATQDEKYPIVFVNIPNSATVGENLNTYSLDIYCLDIIQKDRDNIITILSDTQLILNDIYLDLQTGTDWTIDVTSASMTPLNNDLLDYAAGFVMTLDIEVETYCVTDLPIE